jgi:hypothetical protein
MFVTAPVNALYLQPESGDVLQDFNLLIQALPI